MTDPLPITKERLKLYRADPREFVLDQMVMDDGPVFREVCEPWEDEHILTPIFARDEQGLPRYSLLYLQLMKGAGKTTLLAMCSNAEAVLFPYTFTYLLAGDRDQADILLDFAWDFLERNPSLRRLAKRLKGEIKFDNGSKIIRMSSDAFTSHGLGGRGRRFRYRFDEFWNQPSRDLFDAFFISSGKRPDSQGVILTNPGHNTQTICHEVRELCRTQVSAKFYHYEPTDIEPKHITKEWREQMDKALPAVVRERWIGNRWVSTGSFCTEEDLARCRDHALAPRLMGSADRYYVASLDFGLVKDRTALVIVHGSAGGAEVDFIRCWEGSPDSPVLIADIEADLLRVARDFRLSALVIDPWQMQGTIQKLRALGVPVKEFTFSSANLKRLSQNLYFVINSGLVRWYPDGDLEAELLALNVVPTSSGWKLDHAASGFSDRAIALGMALLEIMSTPQINSDQMPQAHGRRLATLGAEGDIDELTSWTARGSRGVPNRGGDW